MKTFKNSLFLIGLLFFTSCSLTVDVDDEDELARISASAIGDNPNGTVSEDGYLDVTVNAFDRDGIASIRIEIPAINVNFLTTTSAYKSTQSIEQTYEINELNTSIAKTIEVTVIDNEGNAYNKSLAFATE